MLCSNPGMVIDPGLEAGEENVTAGMLWNPSIYLEALSFIY
jgi:hypothetical protein